MTEDAKQHEQERHRSKMANRKAAQRNAMQEAIGYFYEALRVLEALPDTQWGTVGGAWESGTRAAEAVLRKFGALNDASDDKPAKSNTKRKRRRGRGD